MGQVKACEPFFGRDGEYEVQTHNCCTGLSQRLCRPGKKGRPEYQRVIGIAGERRFIDHHQGRVPCLVTLPAQAVP